MALVFVVAAFVLSTFVAFNKPRAALLAAVFAIPWSGVSVDVGLGVSAYLLLITPLFAFCILRAAVRPRSLRMTGMGTFWWVTAYAIVITLIQVPFLPEATVAGGGLRQPAVRSLAQIVMFLITLSPVWIVPSLVRSRSDLAQIGRIYLLSATLLAGIGWLQLAIWVTTGSDPFPVGYVDELLGGQGTQRSGIFEYMGGQIYRMSSFGGEPKGLSAGLGVALLLLQAGVKPRGKYAALLWPFLFASLIATFSTMGILCWLGASLFQFFVTPHGTIKMPQLGSRFKGVLRWTVWFIPIIFVLILSGKSGSVLEMIEMRTTGRITQSERGALEDFNIAVFDFLVDRPLWAVTGTGLGNAHLHADSYLPDFALHYAKGTTFVAKSAVLRWISEIGVVSLLVFLFWALTNALRTVKLAHCYTSLSEVAAIAGRFFLPLLAFWTVSGYITAQLYVTAGFFLSLGLLARAERVRSISSAGIIISPSMSATGRQVFKESGWKTAVREK